MENSAYAPLVVHTKERLRQWSDRVRSFLGIQPAIIGDGKKEMGECPVTVAMVQTLYKCASEVSPFIGHVVVDECHHTPSRTFTEAVTAFEARYLLGLSATPYRRDGLTKLIYWHLGPKVHEVGMDALVEEGHIMEPEIVFRETGFTTCLDPSAQYSKMLSELCVDERRNALIAGDIAKGAGNGGGLMMLASAVHSEFPLAAIPARVRFSLTS